MSLRMRCYLYVKGNFALFFTNKSKEVNFYWGLARPKKAINLHSQIPSEKGQMRALQKDGFEIKNAL